MRKNAHFRGYNDVPWFIKEAIGWPDHYDNLSTEQQAFVYHLCVEIVSPPQLRENLQEIRDDLEEIIEDL
tara:strand:+ start:748 stop:957 length:210 start_codon:yes stop_codon:yes gene_type:complete